MAQNDTPLSREIKYSMTSKEVNSVLNGNMKPIMGVRWLTNFETENEFLVYGSNAIVFENIRIDALVIGELVTDKVIILKECVCGPILFSKSKLNKILICNSSIRNISMQRETTSGSIDIYDGSNVGNIFITTNSSIGLLGLREESKANVIQIQDKSSSQGFYFQEKSKIAMLKLENNCAIENINIRDGAILGPISISDNCTTGEIYISNKSITGEIISYKSEIRNITIDYQCIVGKIELKKSVVGDIVLSNSFCSSINIKHCDNLPKLEITNSRTGELYISDTEIASVYLNKFRNKIILSKWNISSLRIEYSFLSSFRTSGLTAGEVFISDTNINHFNLGTANISASCSLTLARCKMYAAQFEYTNVLGSMFLRRLEALDKCFEFEVDKVEEITIKNDNISEYEELYASRKLKIFEEWKEEHKFHLEELIKTFPQPTFRLVHSSLGKAELSECNFNNFSFQFFNTRVLDCFIVGTMMPDPANLKVYNGKKRLKPGLQWHRQRMSFFNQIKRVYDNTGDTVMASRYHTRAMNQQKKILTLSATFKTRYGRKLRMDQATFWMNWATNNHGENWWRALWVTVVSGLFVFILYSLHLWLRHCWYYGIEEQYGQHIWYHWQSLPEWFLITHRFDFMSTDVGGWGKLWDLLGRIVIGYGIYQFVAAFRRHGKKVV